MHRMYFREIMGLINLCYLAVDELNATVATTGKPREMNSLTPA